MGPTSGNKPPGLTPLGQYHPSPDRATKGISNNAYVGSIDVLAHVQTPQSSYGTLPQGFDPRAIPIGGPSFMIPTVKYMQSETQTAYTEARIATSQTATSSSKEYPPEAIMQRQSSPRSHSGREAADPTGALVPASTSSAHIVTGNGFHAPESIGGGTTSTYPDPDILRMQVEEYGHLFQHNQALLYEVHQLRIANNTLQNSNESLSVWAQDQSKQYETIRNLKAEKQNWIAQYDKQAEEIETLTLQKEEYMKRQARDKDKIAKLELEKQLYEQKATDFEELAKVNGQQSEEIERLTLVNEKLVQQQGTRDEAMQTLVLEKKSLSLDVKVQAIELQTLYPAIDNRDDEIDELKLHLLAMVDINTDMNAKIESMVRKLQEEGERAHRSWESYVTACKERKALREQVTALEKSFSIEERYVLMKNALQLAERKISYYQKEDLRLNTELGGAQSQLTALKSKLAEIFRPEIRDEVFALLARPKSR